MFLRIESCDLSKRILGSGDQGAEAAADRRDAGEEAESGAVGEGDRIGVEKKTKV
jgi:hypothetical protein